jgi:hypothetical protein
MGTLNIIEKQNDYPKILTLDPHPSLLKVLPSKWTGVSLKGCRQNWQKREPGEEKDNDYSTLTARSDTLIDY